MPPNNTDTVGARLAQMRQRWEFACEHGVLTPDFLANVIPDGLALLEVAEAADEYTALNAQATIAAIMSDGRRDRAEKVKELFANSATVRKKLSLALEALRQGGR